MQGNQGCFQESANVLAMSRKLKHDTKTDLYLNKFYCALMPHNFFFKKQKYSQQKKNGDNLLLSIDKHAPNIRDRHHEHWKKH